MFIVKGIKGIFKFIFGLFIISNIGLPLGKLLVSMLQHYNINIKQGTAIDICVFLLIFVIYILPGVFKFIKFTKRIRVKFAKKSVPESI